MASLNKAIFVAWVHKLYRALEVRRVQRLAIWLFIALALYGVLVFFAAPPLLRPIAERQLSAALNRPAHIERLTVNPYTLNIVVDRIHIGERGADFIDIARLTVRPSWFSLLRFAPIINEVKIDSPRFHIFRDGAQHFNFTDLVEKFTASSKPASKPLLFSVSNIRLENGSIYFDDRWLGAKHVIDQIAVSVPFIATLPSKTDIFIGPRLYARIDGSPLAIGGKAKPFAASHESNLTLKFTGLDIPQALSYAPRALPMTVESGKLTTDLQVRFLLKNDVPELNVAGTVDLTDLRIADTAQAPWLNVHALHIAAASLDPLNNTFRFDEVRIERPSVELARGKSGVLSMPDLPFAKPSSTVDAESGTASAAPTPTHPLDVSIKHFTLTEGALALDDRVPAQPVGLKLARLNIGLQDFSTLAKTPARYTMNADIAQGGRVGAAGVFSLAAKTVAAKLTLEAFPLTLAQPYLNSVTAARVTDGALSSALTIDVNWGKTPQSIHIGESEISLKSLKVKTPSQSAPALALNEGVMMLKQVDLNARVAEVTHIDMTGLSVSASRLKDGRLDLAGLSTASSSNTKSQQPAWRYRIGAVNLKDAAAHFTDNSTSRPAVLDIEPIQLSVRDISDDLSQPIPVVLHAALKRKGALDITGNVSANPLKLALNIDSNQLDVAAFEPYLGGALNATIASALLNLKGQLTMQNQALSYRGNAALVKVRMLDRIDSTPLAGWQALSLANVTARHDQRGTKIDVGRVLFDGFFGRVLLNAQGKLNLNDVLARQSEHPAAAPAASTTAAASTAAASTAAASAAAAKPSDEMSAHIGQLVLRKGRLNYTDNFIKPNYSANLIDINGTVSAFGTHTDTPASVDVNAKLRANGPIAIRGTINPLAKKPSLDLTASAHDIELTNLTPYSAKYAGYPITKGKLNVDLHYMLDHDQLSADNHLFIDQLTFGDHVENDTATKLPVRLAISLLKNAQGEIDVNIPVSGSLANPEFSLGSVIWRAVVNLIQKAVTAPFSLLMHAFGNHAEEYGHIEFAPGSAKLTDAAQTKLATITQALIDRPSIDIDITGRAEAAIDTPALRIAYVDRLVRQQKIKSVIGRGASVELTTITVAPSEYDAYLAKAYSAADFKKPRNLIGLAKSLPPEEMKAALAAHAPIDEESLRALARNRAQNVRQYFDGKVGASRVFVLAPKLDKGSGVDLGLK